MSRLHENVLITELTELWLFTVALTMFVLIACYSDVYALDPGQPATNNQLVLFFYFLLVLRCEFVKRIILIAANWIILVDTFGLLPAWLYAMVLFLSITVGVLSEQLNGSNWFWAWRLPSVYPTCYWSGIRVSLKMRVLLSGTLSQTLQLADFSVFFLHGISIVTSVVNLIWLTIITS